MQALTVWVVLCSPQCAWAQALVIRDAVATLEVDGGVPVSKRLTLPHRWDDDYPGRDGRVRYAIQLPAVIDDQPVGLYFARMGNQVEIQINGQVLASKGKLGDASSDATKEPFWLMVPSSILRKEGPNELVVLATVQGSRWGGLSPALWGTEAQTYPVYREQYVWRHYVALAIIFSFLCVGSISAALWWIQRDEVFGWFALAAALGSVRFLGTLGTASFLPWPLQGGLMAAVLQAHMLFAARFFLAVIDFRHPWINPIFYGLLVVEMTTAMAAFYPGLPWLWTLALVSVQPIGFAMMYFLARKAIMEHDRDAMLLALPVLASIFAATRDLIAVRISGEGPGMIFWSPQVTLMFIAMGAWIIIHRFRRQVQGNKDLLATLDARVRQRESELRESYAQVQEQKATEATLLERQRIMRDIHDGVGAQLVGLLSLLKRGQSDPAQLQEHASAALDELRMAVDAMQPVNGDLATVLATLRYRLQPRLVAAGIAVDWQVEALPPMDHLTPQTVLQLQRILLEAFTNMLRHAQASRVRVSARHEAGAANQLVLEIVDNGIGMPDPAPVVVGQGLKNMQARATAIGATLRLDTPPAGGTRVTIVLPLTTQATGLSRPPSGPAWHESEGTGFAGPQSGNQPA